MKLQLIRHATLMCTVNGKTLLIDPMLALKSFYPAFPDTGNEVKNPTADLPFPERELPALVRQVDAVLLTHLHLDHWDAVAQERLPKSIPLFCQPEDTQSIAGKGFTQVTPVPEKVEWNGITIERTPGHHGTGDIEKMLGTVSGYVIAHGDQSVYLAGDTIWCAEVKNALAAFNPNHLIVNGGGARFVVGDPIVMPISDVLTVCEHAGKAKVYVIHLGAVNHSKESRNDVKTAINAANLAGRCFVPDDGEVFIS